jgi:hypothetical protein
VRKWVEKCPPKITKTIFLTTTDKKIVKIMFAIFGQFSPHFRTFVLHENLRFGLIRSS